MNRTVTTAAGARTRVLFVNSGILGMQSFSKYIREAMAGTSDVDARHINLSDDLTVGERAVRWAMCVRLWRDGLFGLNNVDFARLRREYHAGFQAARRLRHSLAAGVVDVLHFHRQATAYASLQLISRVPSIISIDCTQDVAIDAAGSALERWTIGPNAAVDGRIFHGASAIVATSQWAADCLRRRYPTCLTPLHIMPSPVRVQFFYDRWIDERFARTEHGGLPRVLFIGGDFIRKGGEDLLASWTAAGLHRLAALDVVTDWPGASTRGIPGVRVVRGVAFHSPEWVDLWRSADIFALPTRNEAFGTVYQEAAAAGLPRIGPQLNAVPELIADGRSGFVTPPGDGAALADALRALILSPELRRRFGRAARAGVLEHAHPDEYRRKLCDIIHTVAGRRAMAAISA